VLGVEIGLVVALALALLAHTANSERRGQGGLFFWERKRLYDMGRQAKGEVLEQHAHSAGERGRLNMRVHLVDHVIEFTPEGGAPMRIRITYELADGAMTERTGVGRAVPLRYDPARPERAMIDWEQLTGRR
jgi:hypothetical protein